MTTEHTARGELRGGDNDGARQDAPRAAGWDPADVRRLRDFLGDTQTAFAYRLGTRQQTVSEWETGASHPRRMAQRLLHMVAEERGFYEVGSAVESAESRPEPATDSRASGPSPGASYHTRPAP